MKKIILTIIFILGNLLHIGFLGINQILKIADSFSYLQMASKFKDLSIEGFGNGWFGFLYSLPIAIVDIFVKNDMLSAFVVNIILFNLFVFICYLFAKKYLQDKYNFLFVVLLFLSPILLHYNINILCENIYILVFMLLFLGILTYKEMPLARNSFVLGFMIAILYFIRAEAFIYIGSIFLVIFYLLLNKTITFKRSLLNVFCVIISFFIFVSPYIVYMHSFTGEWGLTNKGSSNLRQAELRGISKMDDDGFEQAVGELTADNHHFIAGFAGGLKYDKPQAGTSFKEYLLKNPWKVLDRIKENQIKLYTVNLPNLIVGNAFSLYKIEGSKLFYQNKLFLGVVFIPIILVIYGIIALIRNKEYYLVYSFASFFVVASLFFTLFFVLDRYFIIFVPIFIFFMVYGVENIFVKYKLLGHLKYVSFFLLLSLIYSLGIFSYYNANKNEDAKYEVKKIAGEYLKTNYGWDNLRILERFPIVTYYSGTKERWLTPYTSKLSNLLDYAHFNDINYLVVDSIDFKKYRPDLGFLLSDTTKNYPGLKKEKEFEKNGEKVILYKIVN